MWKRNATELVPATVPTPNATELVSDAAPGLPVPQEGPACIGETLVIRGDVSGSEDLIIDGHVTGRVDLGDYHLVVGLRASVTADLIAKIVSISGTLTGNVSALERAEISATGSVDGDIRAPRIEILDGATVRGRIDTTASDAHDQEGPHLVRLIAS